jgi:DNA polymerase III alpha subunit (gram-positive type)
MTKNLFIDLETDGLNVSTCQITQVAIIDQEGKTLYCQTFGVAFGRYQPRAESEAALMYNKLNSEYWDSLPIFDQSAMEIIQGLLAGKITWAHNALFDWAVLENHSQRWCGRPLDRCSMSCTMELACERLGYPGQDRMKLPQLLTESVPHDALDDVRNCWLLWQKCYGLGRFNDKLQPSLDF